jgi:DNA-binding MarR family transcriptional regulator
MATVSEAEANRLRIALGKISRLVDRQVTGEGMTRTQLAVLGTIARAQTIKMSELAEVEGLNPTMLSRLIGHFEAARLVRRTSPEQDRRTVVVEITAEGSRLHNKLRRERTRLFSERLAGLPAGQADVLMGAIPALESLAEALRASGARVGAGR